ncbi:hypothetical protein KJ966_03665 [bacterium]|nr:hypothetical protein [bacterium]
MKKVKIPEQEYENLKGKIERLEKQIVNFQHSVPESLFKVVMFHWKDESPQHRMGEVEQYIVAQKIDFDGYLGVLRAWDKNGETVGQFNQVLYYAKISQSELKRWKGVVK